MKIAIDKNSSSFFMSLKAAEYLNVRGIKTLTREEFNSSKWHFEFCLVEYDLPIGGLEEKTYKLCSNSPKSEEWRANPHLVSCIEELGSNCASGRNPWFSGFGSCLSIVDIPFDSFDGWYIDNHECSGESVVEDHKSWG
jgi:hypothetical protein